MVDSVEQLEAAAHRLVSARQADTTLWRLRHLRAAVGHMADAARAVGDELAGQEAEELARLGRVARRPRIVAGQL